MDAALGGCLLYGKSFAVELLASTHGWVSNTGCWVDDRDSPRYGGGAATPHQS